MGRVASFDMHDIALQGLQGYVLNEFDESRDMPPDFEACLCSCNFSRTSHEASTQCRSPLSYVSWTPSQGW